MKQQKKADPSKAGNSIYQKKLRLKRGNGERHQAWMWWLESPNKPRRVSP